MDAAVMMAGNTTEGGDMDMPDAHGTAPAYQGPQDVPEEATAAAMEHHGWQDAEVAWVKVTVKTFYIFWC